MARQTLILNPRINRYVGVTSDNTYIELDRDVYELTAEPIMADETRHGQPEADFLNKFDAADPDHWSDDHPAYIAPLKHLGNAAEMGWSS